MLRDRGCLPNCQAPAAETISLEDMTMAAFPVARDRADCRCTADARCHRLCDRLCPGSRASQHERARRVHVRTVQLQHVPLTELLNVARLLRYERGALLC